MSNIEALEKLNNAATPSEEEEILEAVVSSFKKSNTIMTVTIFESGVEIPVQTLDDKIDSNLSVKVTFDNGESVNWAPLKNNNIFLLLRE